MLGNWLTAGHLNRQMVRGGESGHVQLQDEFESEALTGGLRRMQCPQPARAGAKPEVCATRIFA